MAIQLKPLYGLTAIVPANGSYTYSGSGEYFWIASTTQPVQVSVNGGNPFTGVAGPVLNLGGYTSLMFTNSTNAAITVTFYTGSAALIAFAQAYSKDAPTTFTSTFDGAIANGGTVTVPGNTGGFQRRQILVTNLDVNNHPVTVLDSANNRIAVIPAGIAYPWTMPTSATLQFQPPNGQAISSIVIAEVYYSV